MYNTSILSSSRELSAREILAVEDTTNATKLQVGKVINIAYWALVKVEYDDGEFNKLVIVDTLGGKYVTGSNVLADSLAKLTEKVGADDLVVEIVSRKSKTDSNRSYLVAVAC